MNIYLASISIVLGSVITFAYGSWSEPLTFLLVVMAIDYLTGITAAIREGTGLDSSVGFWGLLKKGFILLVVLLAHRVDLLVGQELAMGGAIMFYTVNELLSVIENMGRMGLPMPPQLLAVVRVLRERSAGQEKPGDDSKS
ncbi:holin family protein [Cohnella sp. GCM10027633]|uniref:phage holin family protein n=1 Tax=unclassified Cohnella TaxID=2636738 RepID=UPI0036413D77